MKVEVLPENYEFILKCMIATKWFSLFWYVVCWKWLL